MQNFTLMWVEVRIYGSCLVGGRYGCDRKLLKMMNNYLVRCKGEAFREVCFEVRGNRREGQR